jgi:hypothetical protein
MHEFSREARACSPGTFLNLESLKCHFLDFGERFYRILMVRKRHCNISEALANVFALSPKPGAPTGVGAPGFSRSEPIVVTPLVRILFDVTFFKGLLGELVGKSRMRSFLGGERSNLCLKQILCKCLQRKLLAVNV